MGAWRVLMVCVGVGLPTFGCADLPVAPPADTVQSRAGSAQFGAVRWRVPGCHPNYLGSTGNPSRLVPASWRSHDTC